MAKIQLTKPLLNKCLTGTHIKWIAMVAMIIDHIAISMANQESVLYLVMRIIGRISYPLFAFLAVESFLNTKSLSKYMIGLLVFAVISEVPFNLLWSGKVLYPECQNILWTLLLGIGGVSFYKRFEAKKLRLPGFVIMFVMAVAAVFARVDYNIAGVLMIGVIYLFRKAPIARDIAFAIVAFAFTGIASGCAALVALIPMHLYNGERGKLYVHKYAYYAFYPAHMLLLFGIASLAGSAAIG